MSSRSNRLPSHRPLLRLPPASAARLVALLGGVALCACTSLQSVSLTQVPTDRSRPIRAEATNWALFGIHFDNDFVDEVPDELRRECPNGKVTGILAKQDNTSYFFVARRRLSATAYCVYADPAAAPVPSAPPPPAPPPPEATVPVVPPEAPPAPAASSL